MAEEKRVFSGVQPSADQVHLGNYLGAMRQFVELSKKHQTIVCIVDYHALTTVKKAKKLRENTKSLAAAYLSIGLDPEKITIFKQSDISEVCELAWILSTIFPQALLERAHSFKDAKAKGVNINAAVMTYPILMAADILLYNANLVPVGADQKQHLEMTREIVTKFNQTYGQVFKMPEPLIQESTGVIPGIDGRKMSKSYDNYIGLFEKPKALKKKVMSIVTDSKTVEEPKDPEVCNVYELYKLISSPEKTAELANKYRAGNFGYGHAKLELLAELENLLSPFRDSYENWMSRPEDLDDILESGAKKAKEVAGPVIAKVREAVGLVS